MHLAKTIIHISEKQVSCSPFINDIFYAHNTVMMSYSYIDDSSLIIYKKYCDFKNYPNLIMTLLFNSWMVRWSFEILDLLTHANHASWGEMTKTSHSGKQSVYWLLNIIHYDVSYVSMWWISLFSWTPYVDLDEYVYSLMKHKSKIIWYDQKDFRMKTNIKLTRKTSLYDLIKVTNVLS